MAASQFDYATMVTAQAELEKMGGEIAQFVLDIATDASAVIDGCYTGEAADAYKTAFKNVAQINKSFFYTLYKNVEISTIRLTTR